MCSACTLLLKNSRETGTKGPNCFVINMDALFGEQKERIAMIPNMWNPHVDSSCSLHNCCRRQRVGGSGKRATRRVPIKRPHDSALENILST